jgi:hypothetical protein
MPGNRRPGLSVPELSILVAGFAAFGFTSAYGRVADCARKRVASAAPGGAPIDRPEHVLNLGSMAGTFLAQAVSRFVIGLFPTAPDAPMILRPTAACSPGGPYLS